MLKIFEILLVDPVSGHDSYTKCEVYAPSFMDLAARLENSKICFRGIVETTKDHQGSRYDFVPSPWPTEFARE